VGCVEIIALDEVRARKHWTTLRQRLHEHFDRWLDRLETALPKGEPTLGQVSETIWALRQQLTGGVAETIVHQSHQEEQQRQQMSCPTCARLLPARGPVRRCVGTMVGAIALERPYFYCQVYRAGAYPLDEVLGVCAGRMQPDVQQTAVDLATEVTYETAARLFGLLSGLSVSSERMHTFTHQVAEHLSVVEVAPSREEIARRVGQVAAGRFRRPVLVLGIDGAYAPSRPESARGHRPGQARHRARWRYEWCEAKGFRFYLLDGERIVHVLSWHQVQTEGDLAEALQQVQEAGVVPEDTVRLCVIGDGAEWIWKHVQALFP
jgi:hypothetical protein